MTISIPDTLTTDNYGKVYSVHPASVGWTFFFRV